MGLNSCGKKMCACRNKYLLGNQGNTPGVFGKIQKRKRKAHKTAIRNIYIFLSDISKGTVFLHHHPDEERQCL